MGELMELKTNLPVLFFFEFLRTNLQAVQRTQAHLVMHRYLAYQFLLLPKYNSTSYSHTDEFAQSEKFINTNESLQLRHGG